MRRAKVANATVDVDYQVQTRVINTDDVVNAGYGRYESKIIMPKIPCCLHASTAYHRAAPAWVHCADSKPFEPAFCCAL